MENSIPQMSEDEIAKLEALHGLSVIGLDSNEFAPAVRRALPRLIADWRRMREEKARLKGALRETLWMAQRYAHGRQSYAVGMYNRVARDVAALDVKIEGNDGTIFALDGSMRAEMSGLSQQEFDAALSAIRAKPHPVLRLPQEPRAALGDTQP